MPGVEGRSASEYDDEVRLPTYKWFGEGADLFAGKDVLDLGSGYGGRTVRFKEYGAESVVGVEINERLTDAGEVWAAERGARGVTFRVGTGEAIPADDASFDLAVMVDVMEHVVDPSRVMGELHRVLRPSGQAAIVFPPYYALRGGSHLHGYATTFPGLNLLFRTSTLRRATARYLDERGVDWRSHFRNVPSDKLWTQNGLTVRGFLRLAERYGFARNRIRLTSHFENRKLAQGLSRREAASYAVFRALAQPPVLREAFCERVCALITKP